MLIAHYPNHLVEHGAWGCVLSLNILNISRENHLSFQMTKGRLLGTQS